MSSPGVAAQDASDSEVASLDRAVLSDGLDTILAARRCIAAGTGRVGRYKQLIPMYEEDKQPGKNFTYHYNPLKEIPQDHSLRFGPRLVLKTPRTP
jgi:hypothetical protein